ncbi:hypothetical protein Q9Q99_14635 [Curtobacterium flaccumfaciens]|nr:hypothetical protein Q9Q99_14635 [Curtobacterium flaccumfaciens]
MGDDIGDEIADAPRSERVSFGSDDSRAWQLLLREGWADRHHDDGDDHESGKRTDDAGTNGVSALTNETTVTVLGSPMPVHAQRSC